MMIRAIFASPGGQGARRARDHHRARHRGHRLRADSPQSLEQAVLRCAVAPRLARLSLPARRVLPDRRLFCSSSTSRRDGSPRRLQVKLREGLVHSLLKDWMLPRRAFWLANAGPMGVNPDQRMHEDARQLCRAVGRSWHRIAAGLDPVRDLRRRAVGAVERFQLPHRRPGLRRSPASWSGRPSSMRAPARF